MTDNNNHESDEEEKRRVKDASHTHPDTDETFGDTGTYDRGKKADAEDAEEDEDEEGEDEDRVTDGGRRRTGRRRVKDASHTPPGDVSAQEVYDRGMEGREDVV